MIRRPDHECGARVLKRLLTGLFRSAELTSLALSLRRELGNKIEANPFHYLFVADAP